MATLSCGSPPTTNASSTTPRKSQCLRPFSFARISLASIRACSPSILFAPGITLDDGQTKRLDSPGAIAKRLRRELPPLRTGDQPRGRPRREGRAGEGRGQAQGRGLRRSGPQEPRGETRKRYRAFAARTRAIISSRCSRVVLAQRAVTAPRVISEQRRPVTFSTLAAITIRIAASHSALSLRYGRRFLYGLIAPMYT